MSKVKVLFFAADPLSRPPNGREPRLRLDEEVREVRAKVRAAEHRDALDFDYRLAARPDDLLQGLNEARPQVVHFSGHGGSEGLVLMDPQGRRAHYVDAGALSQLFRALRGNIQLVMLNACFSLPQAQAIADVVGCATGTTGTISDAAAMTFAAAFYRALGFGSSVKAAHEQACAALALSHPTQREHPQLITRRGVDPARIVLVKDGGDTRSMRLSKVAMGGLTVAGLGLAAAVAAAIYLPHGADGASRLVREAFPRRDSSRAATPPDPASSSSGPSAAAAQPAAPPAAPPGNEPDTLYRPPPVDDSGNLVQNGGFQGRFAGWTRSLDGGTGKGTNEIAPFAEARSGHALHLTYEGRGSLLFTQKVPVSGPDYVFRGTFRTTSHEGPMIGFSGTGVAMIMLEYLDADARELGRTRFYSYVKNPLANTPLVGVPRRENGGNTEHYIDLEQGRLYTDFELDVRRELEEHLLGVVPDQIRTITVALYCGATDDGAGAELWASDLSLRPKR